MKTKSFLKSFSLILLVCVLLNRVIVQVNANDNNKTKGGKVPPSVPSGNNSDINSPKKDGENNPPLDDESTLHELKKFTQNLEKKTSTNRNIIISTAVINMVVLALLSGLIGYNTKKGFKKGEKGTAKEVPPVVQNMVKCNTAKRYYHICMHKEKKQHSGEDHAARK
ncbi:sexual stage antigen s16 [Plasmodium cynomolgi strain B]|uniref:Sexual stage antigen s16 n=1 Tax=Plasmodium cynomolgi (strain B) TaxID=1120755 RepID=K6V6J4_PLACD|nr:sexual stage antigen s16 [Plasmodium cynomolgi strain B]GAB64727.1 sexual stage antigen s16 [Plasmodium cynomolgi strain B]